MLRNQWPDQIGMGGRMLSESVAEYVRNAHDGVAVLGMGRDGALMAALLAAQGCRVLCFDRDADRRRLAVDVGATPAPVIDYRSLREATHRAFGGTGAAAVFLTSSWAEEDPLHCAAEIADDGATITQIGASNDYHDIGFLCERQMGLS